MSAEPRVDPVAEGPLCRRTVRTLAEALHAPPPLLELARARRALPFVNLALAAAVAEQPFDAEVLVAGTSLLPDPDLIPVLAARATGDVPAALVAAVDRGGLDGFTQATALLCAGFWAKREGVALPPEIARRARTVARWAPDDDTLAAVLAIGELADDAHLTALLGSLEPEAWRALVQEVADHVARAFVAEPLDRVPEHPVVAPAPKRAKVGRNEACPCGSGKKYKRCCEGKSAEETRILPDDLGTVPPWTLVHRAPDEVPADRRADWLRRLVQGSEVEAVAALLATWDDVPDQRVEAIATASLTDRPEVARSLLEGATAAVPLSATIKLLPRDEALEALEAQAEADLDDGSVVTAWAALRGPLPRLGLLVARAVIADPQVHEDDAAWLLDELLFVRDTLGLPPFDRAETWFGTPAAPDESLRKELEATRAKLEQTAASKRGADAALRHTERERARFESEAARAARRPDVVEAAADPVELADLRGELRRLKAAHKEVHDDRNHLRREVVSLQEALDDALASAADQVDADAQADADDSEAGVTLAAAEVRTGQRLPRFPEGFLDGLGQMPPATGATALQRVGELCGGRAVGWRDVKNLQGFDNVWRVRIGRSYRLLFRVHEQELEILDLVHRQDLEKKLHHLRALR